MKVYQASKLAAGVSKVFPHKLTITESSVTITQPGLFSAKEKTIPFSKISSVNIDCPMIGFSTITIETTGEGNITTNGFTKDEVREMKQTILGKI
jgi:uncharacterized membrane protein YdbT with pleckstrin-like domain